MRFQLATIIATLSLILVGCDTTHTFSVNSLNHPAPIGNYKTFAIAAGPEIENPESLEFREASRFARTALISEGYREAGIGQEPDLLVELGFDISEPQTTVRERAAPVYAHYYGGYRPRVVKVYGKNGHVSKRVVYSYYPSRSRLVGWGTDISTKTVFEKSMTMRAYTVDPKSPDGHRKEIWMVDVRNRSKSEDLRYYIPRMIAAALDYIDYDSESLQRVSMAESDPRVQLILDPAYL
ncbi:MAG: DUF4136 domain-containing protein [Verrucomicrobiota bacterium]